MPSIGKVIAHSKLAISIMAASGISPMPSTMIVVTTHSGVIRFFFRTRTSRAYRYSNISSRNPTPIVIGVISGATVPGPSKIESITPATQPRMSIRYSSCRFDQVLITAVWVKCLRVVNGADLCGTVELCRSNFSCQPAAIYYIIAWNSGDDTHPEPLVLELIAST